MDQTLSLLVHANSKVGKTTLAATAPTPILALDAEGGWKFLPVRRVYWDPTQYAPPVYDGTWDVCIVTIRDWNTVQRTYQWMISGQHPFVSIVIDSITEIQRRCKQNLVSVDKMMEIRDWGKLLDLMDATIRGFRDLTMHPTKPVQVVVFIAETRYLDNKWRPYMQGQIGTALPYWMDVVGYLFMDNLIDANGAPTTKQLKLLVSPHPTYEAGERVRGRLGDMFDVEMRWDGSIGTDIQRMLQMIYTYDAHGFEPAPMHSIQPVVEEQQPAPT